ncbi:hypothetical protein [Pseudomonas carnis]|uniref:hypothetical protein n=1 Tax=Pseudomonas carnis TaxID=2487355 RepID=UPI00244A88EF|nr:hypothetical protein [Pseudomonas carnis]MDH0797530.1 hypothetical protein [Pseudomonas carnis]
MNIEDGGSAFPEPGNAQCGGMSLRDYFAAGFAAAQATTTSADTGFINAGYVDPRDGVSVAEKIARSSYALADAMLAARSA